MTEPSEADSATKIAFYEAVRAEAVVRLQQRDMAVFSFVVVVGSYFGFVCATQLTKPPSADQLITETVTMLALPVLCACFMLVYSQHHLIVALLERYIKTELYPGVVPPPLDASKNLQRFRGPTLELGFFAQSGLIASPLLYSLVYWARNKPVAPAALTLGPADVGSLSIAGPQMVDAVLLFASFSFVVVFAVAVYAYVRRNLLYRW